MGEDAAAGEAEQAGDEERDQQRALQRFAEREPFADDAPADEPLARWQACA